MDMIFARSGLAALPFWLLMIFLPRWRVTQRLMQSYWPPSLAAVLYAALVLPRLGQILPAVSHPTLAGIASLLSTPAGATIAWAHFLAFDLFIGRWIYLDSRERHLHPLLMAPILYLTLMLGPVGYLLYLAVRSVDAYRGPLHARLRTAYALNPPLAVLTLANLGLFLFALLGLLIDHRIITGAPAWLKPAKFGISVSIFAATLLWMMTYISGYVRRIRALSWVVTVTLMIENVFIALQAARGTTSHFNFSTPLNTAIFALMGASIAILWIATAVVAVLLVRQRLPDPAFALSLRLGLIVSLLGMLVGVLMVSHLSTAQRSTLSSYERPLTLGGHAVGVAEDAHGLPGLDWKTGGGDLRVPHFVGIHGLQILPLLGWLLTLPRARRLHDKARVGLVWTAAVSYLLVVLALVWQALRGQSVVAPDITTLAVFGGIALAAALSCGVLVMKGYQAKPRFYLASEAR